MNKKIIVMSLMCVVVGVIAWYWLRESTQPDRNVLRVGMMSGWAPFMTLNAQGQYEGFDVDVARALAKTMGRAIEIIDYGSLAPLFIALDQGKIDCIISGLDITQERLSRMTMVPYFGSGFDRFYLLFWQQVPVGVTTFDDLRRLKPIIAVEPGSASEKFVQQYPELQQKSLASVPDMLMDVKYGRSTAAILEPVVARRVMKQMPELKALEVPIPPAFRVYGMGIALRRDRVVLSRMVGKAIEQLKRDGTITQCAKRWGLSDDA